MKFSFHALIVTLCAVVISAVVSCLEGTLTNRRVTMGFLNHAGMWCDLIIMPTLAGLIYPYITGNYISVSLSFSIALISSVIVHALWWKLMQFERITTHIYPTHSTGRWFSDLSAAGWMHIVVMTFLVCLLTLYAISPMPKYVVFSSSILLTIHVFLACIQPGWYCKGEIISAANLIPPSVLGVIIWVVAIWKIYSSNPR